MSVLALAGRPFARTGRSRTLRDAFAALSAAGVPARLVDLAPAGPRDPELWRALGPALAAEDEPADAYLVHAGVDQIEEARQALARRPRTARYEAVAAGWGLGRYPSRGAFLLDGFDEIWVPSRFLADALRPLVTKPIAVLPSPVAPVLSARRTRRSWGIPESAFAFAAVLDARSGAARFNVEGAAAAFAELLRRRPAADAVLVVFAVGRNGVDGPALRALAPLGSRAVVVTSERPEEDRPALLYACDALVSLHRLLGFGRPVAEAMALGKPVIATDYSGTASFVNPENALPVGYELREVPPAAQAGWMGQLWAEPSVPEAASAMERLLLDEGLARRLGQAGERTAACTLSPLACGLRMLDHLSGVGVFRGTPSAPPERGGVMPRNPNEERDTQDHEFDDDEKIDQGIDESFPASDPPSFTPMTPGEPDPDPADERP